MTSLFRIGQCLTGKLGTYTIHKQVQDFIWLASNKVGQNVLVKSAHHPRIANERSVLKLFQSQAASLRPLVDEIEEPGGPTTIVLKHLDDDLHDASAAKRLTSSEIKYVSKKILEGLKVIHEGGYVHTDVKLDNVLVNYGPEESGPRFTDVQLADLENTVHVESKFCKDRDAIGAPLWRSPEAQLGLQWGPAADIWAFGSMVISLIWGNNFFIFKPDVPRGHDEYEFKILEKYHIYFGPYPPSFADLADDETLAILSYIMDNIPREKLRPFSRASQREISKEDKEFVLKIMKIDPRDRPSAKQLLGDEWFNGV